MAPQLRSIGVIYNPDTGRYAPQLIASDKAAAGKDVSVIDCPVHNDKDIEAAASSLGSEPHPGLLILPEPFTNAHRDQIISQAARFRLPTLMSIVGATKRGALLSYNYSFDVIMRQPVAYIDRILKGESPSELPVQAPIKFELSINLKTSRTLGLTVPAELLAIADEVIE
jgi:putative ABC transport system substrate-binding protein